MRGLIVEWPIVSLVAGKTVEGEEARSKRVKAKMIRCFIELAPLTLVRTLPGAD